MTIYERVLDLLTNEKGLRSDDRALIWKMWIQDGCVKGGVLTKADFRACTMPESITRARREVQEKYPELHATQRVEEARREKEQTKGKFIFDEERQVYIKIS